MKSSTLIPRKETRLERYNRKIQSAQYLPATLVTVNFHCDGNLAFIVRSAACYGISTIHVIGSIPPRNELYRLSGSTCDNVEIKQYSNPSSFLRAAENEGLFLICAEITDDSKSLFEYEFDFSKKAAIVIGNEMSGIPIEIMMRSQIIHIPMLGSGFCLNNAQTGTAFLNEFSRQYYTRG